MFSPYGLINLCGSVFSLCLNILAISTVPFLYSIKTLFFIPNNGVRFFSSNVTSMFYECVLCKIYMCFVTHMILTYLDDHDTSDEIFSIWVANGVFYVLTYISHILYAVFVKILKGTPCLPIQFSIYFYQRHHIKICMINIDQHNRNQLIIPNNTTTGWRWRQQISQLNFTLTQMIYNIFMLTHSLWSPLKETGKGDWHPFVWFFT